MRLVVLGGGVGGIASGITTTSPWSRGLMRWCFAHGILSHSPAEWAIA